MNREEVRIEKNILIPLGNEVSLAADLYLPAGEGPFPTLVSFYPYHKDDLIGAMLEYPRRYFAEQGYAHLLVDFRGSGNSTGKAWEMMDPGENRDGAYVVEWAAQQPWCDGNIGMWGISYGGISSLETASERPPHLKAIAPVFASVDIYHDFLYAGGCMNCLSGFGTWGSFMVAMNLMPPGYQDPQGRWYQVWKERLEKNQPYALPWQDHPAYDEYWRSRVIPIEKIKVPTFVIGAWRDIFPETAVRLYEKISVPKKLVMGPWTHSPVDMYPFERWDYVYELKRWWDHWLKGEKNGIVEEPPVTIYIQGPGGAWRHENEWPIVRTQQHSFSLTQGNILADKVPDAEFRDTYQAVPTVGVMAGLWDPLSLCLGLPLDQGPDDLQSLTYTTEPLLEEVEITGSPEAIIHASLEEGEEVNLVAKLNHLAPDGRSYLITTGCLNGSHHNSHEEPEPLQKGREYEFRILLWATSYSIPKGHRLRLSISCSDFPRMWPTSSNPTICLISGGAYNSHIRIPVVPPPATQLPKPEMRRPDPAVNRAPSVIDAVPLWRMEQDLVSGTTAVVTGVSEAIRLPTGGTLRMDHTVKASVRASRPDGATVRGTTNVRLDLPAAGSVEVEARTLVSRTRMTLAGKVTVDGQLFFEKKWQR